LILLVPSFFTSEKKTCRKLMGKTALTNGQTTNKQGPNMGKQPTNSSQKCAHLIRFFIILAFWNGSFERQSHALLQAMPL